MSALSRETIRFRLWQLRLSQPDIPQNEAAEWIGCTAEQLRIAQPLGWKWGGSRAGNPGWSPASTEVDTFVADPARFRHNRRFSPIFVETNESY